MTKHKYEHPHTRYPQPEVAEIRVPYWRRAHRDWRFLAVVFLMLVAMGVYVATLNLSLRPRGQGQGLPLVDTNAK
jgi:hypothetical protein